MLFRSFLGGGIAGTMLVLRKRKYGKLVHERNLLLEEQAVAKAKGDLAHSEEERRKLRAEQRELEKGSKAMDEKITQLERKHDRVKLSLEDVSSWDDLKID